MSSFDLNQAAPGLLRAESLNITLKFDRTGETTGRVSWNLPSPAAGCTAENQAYCGMLVTIDTSPASASKIPTNGTVYESDTTADSNLFAGSSIGTSMVIGAYYTNRTTTFFDIAGLKPNTPYYVSGFPVDCQLRYFIEGVHAYSQDFRNRGTDGTHGTNIVVLNPGNIPMGAQLTDYTGLSGTVDYDFSFQLGATPTRLVARDHVECPLTAPQHSVAVNGTNAQTYADLVVTINRQLSLLSNPPAGPSAPNTGAYYWNSSQQKLFLWDGAQHVAVQVLISATAPNNTSVGSYWFEPTAMVLNQWNGLSWSVVTYLTLTFDPTAPVADRTYWYDGTNLNMWNGTIWCRITSITQAIDPSLPPLNLGGSYWYNSVNNILYNWDNVLELWEVTSAIEYHENPNTLTPGAYWFNKSISRLYAYNGPSLGWAELTTAVVTELAPSAPTEGQHWYNLLTQKLFVRTGAVWTQHTVLVFPTDPTARLTCDLWWNTLTNALTVWDSTNSVWVATTQFYQQASDPSLPPGMTDGFVWFNSLGKMYVWQNNCFTLTPYITYTTDPITTLTNGTVWYNPTTSVWKVRQLGAWVTIGPLYSTNDPTTLVAGSFWFNTVTSGLQMWNGISWVSVMHSLSSLAPDLNTLWFDTTTNTLKMWTSLGWVVATPLATVEMDCNGNLLFTDTTIGSTSFIQILRGTLFGSLDAGFAIDDPSPGTDGASDEPAYNELGIGTDGSIAIRAKLANDLRYDLGYPVVDVELTPEQLDHAINLALEQFRARSGMAYKRGFFFIRLTANTQRYFLTNKTSGMNKITEVLGVYRMTSAFVSSAHGAGVYGQIVVQHLYNMGTFDLLSYHIMSEYTKLMEMLFAARITYQWNEQTRELFINHRFSFTEKLACIEATSERTEQDLMTDRYVRAWIRKWASAQCRMMLAETRGKFSTLPGAGGGVTLNASDLRQQAMTDMEACLTDIDEYIMDGPDQYGMGSQFTFG